MLELTQEPPLANATAIFWGFLPYIMERTNGWLESSCIEGLGIGLGEEARAGIGHMPEARMAGHKIEASAASGHANTLCCSVTYII